jgi:hypothetical protein
VENIDPSHPAIHTQSVLLFDSRGIVLEETQAFSDREMKTFFDLIVDKAPPLHKAVILLLLTAELLKASS